MFVLELSSDLTNEIDVITGNTVTDVCSKILNYTNGVKYNKLIDYDVKFFDSKGDLVLAIPETALNYAIFGKDVDDVSNTIKEYSQDYWEMNHSTVEVIEFTNPSHKGEVIWDHEYTDLCGDSDVNISKNSNIDYDSDNHTNYESNILSMDN